MNYITQINAFEDWLETNPLPDTAQLMWYKLMCINNKCGWLDWFDLANTTLMAKMNISSEKTLISVRNILIDKGRVRYKPSGNRKKAGRYSIVPFRCEVSTVKNTVERQAEREVEATVETAVEVEVETTALNKLNKTKRNISLSKIQKQAYAQYVTLTEEEHAKLIGEYGVKMAGRIIEVLNNYKGSTGKTYKSDYLAILNWVVGKVEGDMAKSTEFV
jgi:hypothetical protein